MNQLQRLTRDDVAIMRWVAQNMIESKMLPASIDKPEKAIAILMMARELNVPDWQAVNQINVIHGKPTVSPQLMIALIERSGLLEDMIVESGEGFCSVTMKRFGRTAHKETFTMEHAKKMGLAGKHNWKVQPETMLKWRAVSACARVSFPHVISGLYTPEEINPDLVVDSDGKIEVTASTYVPQEEKASTSTEAIEAEEAKDPKILELPKPETKEEADPEEVISQNDLIKLWSSLHEKIPNRDESAGWMKRVCGWKKIGVASSKELTPAKAALVQAEIDKLPDPEPPKTQEPEEKTKMIKRDRLDNESFSDPKKSALERLEEELEYVRELEDDDPVNLEQLKVLLEVATSQNKKALAKSITKKVEGGEKVSKALWKTWVEKINMGEAPK